MTATIALKGDFVQKEGEASAAITPGHLIMFGGANDLQVHGTSGGYGRKAFAFENDLIGRAISDAYALGETVKYGVFSPGAEVYALLDGAENVAKGAALVSAGDGSLREIGTEPEQDSIIAYAMEAVNNSTESTGGAHARIIVEVA